MKKAYSKILEIKPAGKNKVYDFTVKDTHRILANNFYTSNCHIDHPDILKFITAKDDRTNVTGANISVKVTDKFMEAVEKDADYYLRWPILDKNPEIKETIPYNSLHILDDGTYVRRVKAKEIWNAIVKQAHKNGEPGVIFWNQIISESPADAYAEDGFVTKGTNPCITGDTLVSVADGRGEVWIDQLVKLGKDVPVYCLNDKGDIEIQIMRNPRITGYNEKIYKITFDSGDSVRVTGNHKIRLKNGLYEQAKNLKYGDSVHTSSILYAPICDKNKENSKNYKFIRSGNSVKSEKCKSEHRLIYEFNNGLIPDNHVIHHVNYNTLDNSLYNLKCMSKEDHDFLHIKDKISDKNPYPGMTADVKFNFALHKSETNSHFSGISNFKLYREIIKKTTELNRRISKKEWETYAKETGLPEIIHSEFRGCNGNYLLERAANYLKLEFIDKDPRLVRTYFKAINNGYEAKIENHTVMISKKCEECGNIFWQEYTRREISFCSKTCSDIYINKNTDTNIKRLSTINDTYAKKGEINKNNQLRIYSQLKFNLKREPFLKEWEIQCKSEKVACRLDTKNGFNKWDDVKKLAKDYNHKVISVEIDGVEDVYNGTVDKYHNFFTILKPFNQIDQSKQFIINHLNCGEVPLSPSDSCRLGSLNLYTLVNDPFTKDAHFNWSKLADNAHIAQRFMDDIVDLEEEKILTIIEKIKNDAEDPDIKANEIRTWEKVLSVLKKGRRTGIGVLGLSDALAAIGIKYGTPEATKIAEDIQKCIAINSYKESINLAKERGHFPIWNADKESHNAFIRRIISDNFDNNEYKKYIEYGRRNIANISIAPTGTLSILSQTSSGIEPVFKIYYRRRRKINPEESDVKIDYVDDIGDSWTEYNVIHYPFIHWYIQKKKNELKDNEESTEDLSFESVLSKFKSLPENILDQLITESPWNGAESHDIDYIEKIRMQGNIQKWVDHSISNTINLPEKVSLDEVDKIYFHGWKSKCKGLTIYRDGSRSGVLLSRKDNNREFVETNAPKRPDILESDYYIAKAKGREFAVIIGLWPGTNKPFEVFAFENPPMSKNTKGKTIKVKNGHYKFVNGEFEIDNLQLAAHNIEERMLTLTASMILRHGAPIKYVNSVIKKIDDNIISFSSVVRRYLSKYIPAEHINGESCPECGDKLIMQDGCQKCLNPACGFSKCG